MTIITKITAFRQIEVLRDAKWQNIGKPTTLKEKQRRYDIPDKAKHYYTNKESVVCRMELLSFLIYNFQTKGTASKAHKMIPAHCKR